MLKVFKKFRYGLHNTTRGHCKICSGTFIPIIFFQKANCIFKASLFSFSIESLLIFVSTTSKCHNPPKSSNCLSNLSFSSVSLFYFFSFCSMLSFDFLFFLSKINFLFHKYEVFCLLLDFLANSRALSSSSGVNLFLY